MTVSPFRIGSFLARLNSRKSPASLRASMPSNKALWMDKSSLISNSKFSSLKSFTIEYYELLEHCLGSLEQVKSKGWSRTEPAPIF